MTVSHCSSRNVTILAPGAATRSDRAGQITRHLAQALAALEPAPTATSGSPWIGSRGGRRLDAQPAAEVLARIDVVVDARSIDLWDHCCLQGQAISGARRPASSAGCRLLAS